MRLTRDIDLAEECTQDAFVLALTSWADGVPEAPAAWLTTVAKHRALDAVRRQAALLRRLPGLVVDDHDQALASDPLRLIFTCCHPAIAVPTQVALTLRLVLGLSTTEVASSLLISEPTAAARITRGKRKIAAASIPFSMPAPAQLGDRLDAVLTVIQLLFTTGHTGRGAQLWRRERTARALSLGRMLADLLPDESEVLGLLATMVLTEARGEARVDADGEMVLLAEQDRDLWNTDAARVGLDIAARALNLGAERPGGIGRFAIQAAIAGLHVTAASWESTDWQQIATMYDALFDRWPSPVVALNRVAARSLAPGVDLAALLRDDLTPLRADPQLAAYTYLPATAADVLRRLGRLSEAAAEYERALALTHSDTERRFLQRRLAETTQSGAAPRPPPAAPESASSHT
jgi:RNA polymerase sigma-70 factor, ECF subfamily